MGKRNKTPAFRVRKRKVIFAKGPIRLVDCDVQMPDGRVLSRQILEHGGAVVIVPRLAKDRYLLIRQFRFATQGWLWEFPAGGVEAGETFRKAAVRELIEETSFRPRKIQEMISFYPTPGVSAEVMHIYLAEDLVPDTAEKDEDEEIEIHDFSLAEIGNMIRQKKIIDGKTIVGYYLLKEKFGSA